MPASLQRIRRTVGVSLHRGLSVWDPFCRNVSFHIYWKRKKMKMRHERAVGRQLPARSHLVRIGLAIKA